MRAIAGQSLPHDGDGNNGKKMDTLLTFYPEDVERIRGDEYPLLKDTTYLDHAGTTLHPKSLIGAFSREMTSNIYGNPHSVSSASQLTSRRIDDSRLKALRFFNADPEHFDLVFVANATAGIKLVADAMRDSDCGFWYGYHMDSHTSLTGVRELAERGKRYFVRDEEVTDWMESLGSKLQDVPSCPTLFAYPAQSNMTGRRLPLSWCGQLRKQAARAGRTDVFSLLDAASLVSTSPLDLSDARTAPDFTVLSFYKIFGFPDLGALIVRKASAYVFRKRKYFGGGTVDMVISAGQEWHAKKDTSVHEQLEDGTLPFHNIIALDCAIDVHQRLYGSMENISKHTSALCKVLYDRLSSLRHANGRKVCEIYASPTSRYGDRATQGPLIAFNLKDSRGNWVGKSDVEKLAAVKDIQIRSGSLCNPGGTAYHMGLTDAELRRNYAAGARCGNDVDIIAAKPTGALRVSLGAMTSMRDIDRFMDFIEEFYVDKERLGVNSLTASLSCQDHVLPSRFYIERLCVYPIKSCGAFVVPDGMPWRIMPDGLSWDREWCLIHQGTGSALNQKRYPRMALIRPYIDLERGVLRVFRGLSGAAQGSIEIPLSREESHLTTAAQMCQNSLKKDSIVCGERVTVQAYTAPSISHFFSSFLGVPCTLARFPRQSSTRFSKDWNVPVSRSRSEAEWDPPSMPGAFPGSDSFILSRQSASLRTQLRLSNESPLLLISRSSVNRLNEIIKSSPSNLHRKAVSADVFRANIIVAEHNLTSSPHSSPPRAEHPYVEDRWSAFYVTSRSRQSRRQKSYRFDVLGSCQRCQMICIDQYTGEKSDEPFSTLSKTRKVDGKVLFGRHTCLSTDAEFEVEGDGGDRGEANGSDRFSGESATFSQDSTREGVWVKVGDDVTPVYAGG
ncbi:hypothetical protein VTO42DRAFT_1293 [Malbranchea cinnamomea]